MDIFFRQNTVPRLVILIIEMMICIFALLLAFELRFNFKIGPDELERIKFSLILVIPVRLLLFIVFRTFADIVRYTGTRDTLKVLVALGFGSVIFALANLVSFYVFEFKFLVPYSIIVIDFFVSTVLLVGFRMFVKLAYMEMNNPRKGKTDVVIFGAGESGLITKRSLDRDAGSKYKVVAFVDDDDRKTGMKLEGVPIFHTGKLTDLLKPQSVAHLIISIQNLSPERKKEIADLALHFNTKVLVVPPVFNWINGELSFKQMKKIRIEELLEREVIEINNAKVKDSLANQVVLVTGAAGSIGSEIVRQVLSHSPQLVLCLDQSETGLYHLDLGLQNFKGKYLLIVGDVNDEQKMRSVFSKHKPVICFHAAAYKHVPLMESQVSEAIRNNVLGTKCVADLAVEFHCEKFVMISTDKAVNPTSVMGASKRMAEIYIQTLNEQTQTQFITTRFGNVLGSNGSVIPLFRKQIENGGPITVTHPEVTRYFMTITEACQLVLEAGAMGNGGEIFMFDMGKSVKIADLARKMIQLSGLTIGKDIQIVFTGLRPGEKLYEELLNTMENTIPTYHKRIMIASVKQYEYDYVVKEINELKNYAFNESDEQIVRLMKQIIPEYKSQNSIYEKLDQ